VTGYAEPSRAKARIDQILKKPFRMAQLAEKLRHILRAPRGRQNGRNGISLKEQ
jgi:DNA-binding response OmpR family regulator